MGIGGRSTYTRPARVWGVHGGCHHTHPAVEPGTVGRDDSDWRTWRDAGQFRRGHLGAPFEASLADQAKQLRPAGNDRTDRRAARGDDARVRRQHLRVLQAQQLGRQHRLGRLHARQGGLLGGQVLADLLSAEGACVQQGADAVGVGGGLGRLGAGFGDAGTGLGHIGLHAVVGKARQCLTALDHVAHVHQHLGQAQTIAFGADTGFLPGSDVAIGAELDRQLGCDGLGGGHRQCGPRRSVRSLRGRIARLVRCAGAMDVHAKHSGDDRHHCESDGNRFQSGGVHGGRLGVRVSRAWTRPPGPQVTVTPPRPEAG
jgi:hypothetical protein